jgi:hypothetical protein
VCRAGRALKDARAGVGSPEGSTLALPYGTSRNNSVETFATYNSGAHPRVLAMRSDSADPRARARADEARATNDAYDSDQSMLEDKR